MKHFLQADLCLDPVTDNNCLPNLPEATRRQINNLDPLRLSEDDHDFMMDEAHRREDFDHEEDMLDVSDSEEEESEEEEYDEDIVSDDSVGE